MKRFLMLVVVCAAIAPKSSPAETISLEPIGVFSNMRFTEEHQYGSEVQLWRQGDKIVGLFSNSEGLAGDTPSGVLEEVHFDPSSKALAFKAKLSMGVVIHEDPDSLRKDHKEWVPSRDVFVFKGVIKKDALVGDLGVGNGFYPDGMPTTYQAVKLPKEPGTKNMRIQATNYEDWKAQVDKIMQVRGPKW